MVMSSWLRVGWASVVGVAVTALTAGPVLAQGNSKKVTIPTFDGVELQGTLWPAGGTNRDACVLLLHDFDIKKGGSSHQDGWDNLAEDLQKDGYTVLSFDFRGFGESKSVDKKFWNSGQFAHNRTIRGARKMPETIDQKDFPLMYYPVLVNDVAAAKAYLDRQNDLKILNSSNIIVVGAGDGATIGALWMATAYKLARAPGGLLFAGNLDEPEGKDLVCAVWLTMSPRLATKAVNGLDGWLLEVARKHKVPMLFVYGKSDREGEGRALNHLQKLIPGYQLGRKPTEKSMEYTRDWSIKGTSLTGSKLLNKGLDTISDVKFYINDNMAKRGAREQRNRDYLKSAYYWVFGKSQTQLAKRPGDEMPYGVPLQSFRAGQ
jgi:hypothetical protein